MKTGNLQSPDDYLKSADMSADFLFYIDHKYFIK